MTPISESRDTLTRRRLSLLFGQASSRFALAGFTILSSISCGFAQGLLPEDPAVVGTLPKAQVHRDWLPPSVDLSSRFPPPGDQGSIGSCTGWAVGYGLRSYLQRQKTGVDLSVPGNRFNPMFVYNRVSNSCSDGARLTDAMRFIGRTGALPFSEFASTTCPDNAGPAQLTRAADYKVGNFRVVRSDRSDDIKGELAQQRPVVFGIMDTRALHKLGPNDIYTAPSGEYSGNHAMVVVGYDDRRQAFKVMNSWGQQWGNGGFGWIDYVTYTRETTISLTADPQASPVAIPTPPPAPALPPSPPVVPAPSPDPIPSLRSRLQAFANTLQCARLEMSSVGRITGFVRSEPDLEALRRAVSSPIEGVVLRPWPQCETLLTLREPLDQSDGLTVQLQPPAQHCPAGTLCAGDNLVTTVRMPRRSSYLYLAYIQASGDTLILEQPSGDVPTPHRPNDTVIFGKGAGQPDMRVTAPFGREMIIALASASPLFDGKLPDQMTEREFLTVLRRALIYKQRPSDPARVVAAAVIPLTTGAQ